MPLFAEDLGGTLGRGADPESGHALELAAPRFRPGAGALAAEGDWCYKDGRAPTGRGLLCTKRPCQLQDARRRRAGRRGRLVLRRRLRAQRQGTHTPHKPSHTHNILTVPAMAEGATRMAANLPVGKQEQELVVLGVSACGMGHMLNLRGLYAAMLGGQTWTTGWRAWRHLLRLLVGCSAACVRVWL